MALAPSQRDRRGHPLGVLCRAAVKNRHVEPTARGRDPNAVGHDFGFDTNSDPISTNRQAVVAGVTVFTPEYC